VYLVKKQQQLFKYWNGSGKFIYLHFIALKFQIDMYMYLIISEITAVQVLLFSSSSVSTPCFNAGIVYANNAPIIF